MVAAAGSQPCQLMHAGGECGVPYRERFAMPYNASVNWTDGFGRTHGAEWYSFDHGPVHFLTYSTEFDFAPGSPQYQCAFPCAATTALASKPCPSLMQSPRHDSACPRRFGLLRHLCAAGHSGSFHPLLHAAAQCAMAALRWASYHMLHSTQERTQVRSLHPLLHERRHTSLPHSCQTPTTRQSMSYTWEALPWSIRSHSSSCPLAYCTFNCACCGCPPAMTRACTLRGVRRGACPGSWWMTWRM